ncbi:MAG: hypothetical protein LBG79_08895 [Spirochaetaceae bacterium]|jgi:hypothetical protein|nr:hypothetical protein [Spirochaetaceae bacterium]GMO20555.1 MAG: hypothetical protein Pg6A_07330 [Termitinemataceae bacterium]
MGLKDKITAIGDTIEGTKWSAKRRITGFFSQKSVKIYIALFALICVLAVVITIFVAKALKNKKTKAPPPMFAIEKIAEEDIFLPGEPDFLPEILFEQGQKKYWTKEDALEFWTDPAEFGDEVWLKKASEIIDEVLERVP